MADKSSTFVDNHQQWEQWNFDPSSYDPSINRPDQDYEGDNFPDDISLDASDVFLQNKPARKPSSHSIEGVDSKHSSTSLMFDLRNSTNASLLRCSRRPLASSLLSTDSGYSSISSMFTDMELDFSSTESRRNLQLGLKQSSSKLDGTTEKTSAEKVDQKKEKLSLSISDRFCDYDPYETSSQHVQRKSLLM